MRDAIASFDDIAAGLERRPPVLFFDYDGTLTPIVDDPSAAELAPAMRERLRRLAERHPVAVISGRDLPDVRRRVGVAELFYAGSHGFDIEGPGRKLEQPEARRYLPALARAEQALRHELEALPGVRLERKRFACALHYRQVAEAALPRVAAVAAAVAEREGLRRSAGKMVWELQPPLAWDKGRALGWVLAALALEVETVTPFYLGDDLTDEDAFRALPAHGIAILVGGHAGETVADYRLQDPDAVARFVDRMLAHRSG